MYTCSCMVQKSKYGSTDKDVDVKEWLAEMSKADPAR
jgi:hypothetical protein